MPSHPAACPASSILRTFQLVIVEDTHDLLFFAIISRWNRRRLGPLWSLIRELTDTPFRYCKPFYFIRDLTLPRLGVRDSLTSPPAVIWWIQAWPSKRAITSLVQDGLKGVTTVSVISNIILSRAGKKSQAKEWSIRLTRQCWPNRSDASASQFSD